MMEQGKKQRGGYRSNGGRPHPQLPRFAISEITKLGMFRKKYEKVQEKAHLNEEKRVNTCTFQKIVVSLHQK